LGKKVSTYTGPGISYPAGIAPGPDGALWFANHGSASLGRITTSIGPIGKPWTRCNESRSRSTAAAIEAVTWG